MNQNKKSLTKKVLLALLTGGAIVLALSSPTGAHRLIKAVGYELKKRRERTRLLWTLAYLRRKKYIKYQEQPDGITQIILSEDGQRRALRYKLEDLTLPQPKKWDGRYRLIAFDIPESKRAARDAFRATMEELGLVQLQKSLWAWPYDCQNEIDFIAEVFGVGPYVHYIVADSITSEKFLKYKFGLA